MIKSFKEASKLLNEKIKRVPFPEDENKNAIIKINVQDDCNFLSPYSFNEKDIINQEVAEFLAVSTKGIPVKKNLHLEIISSSIDNQEKKIYKEAIVNYYTLNYQQNALEMKRELVIACIMAFVSIIGLIIMLLLSLNNYNSVLIEIIDIFSWVFMWEAVDLFFLRRGLFRFKQYRNLAFIGAEIEFIDKEKKK